MNGEYLVMAYLLALVFKRIIAPTAKYWPSAKAVHFALTLKVKKKPKALESDESAKPTSPRFLRDHQSAYGKILAKRQSRAFRIDAKERLKYKFTF